MPRQSESDHFGADGAAQRLRQMLRTAFLRRSALKDESPARSGKPRTPKRKPAAGKSKRK
jgi:hypothetical protein